MIVDWPGIKQEVKKRAWGGLRPLGITRSRVARLLGGSKLTPADLALLNEMRRQNRESGSPFAASDFWLRLQREFDDWFHWEGIGQVEQQTYNQLFSAPRPSHPKLYRYACYLLYQNLKSRDRFNLLTKIESQQAADSSTPAFDGQRVSWDLLISMDTIFSLLEVAPELLTEPRLVADLGAGWGRIGWCLKKINPKLAYIVFDLPETLLISSTYLPRLLTNEKVVGYHENDAVKVFQRDNLISMGGLRFMGNHHLKRFESRSIDIFLNIASFQEMTATQVSEYFDLISEKVRGIFYVQQLWDRGSNRLSSTEIGGFDAYPFKPEWEKVSVRNITWSDLYFEAIYKLGAHSNS